MFVAKLPGSTYATAAMNAGPRNGSRRRRRPPCAEPFSTSRAAFCVAPSALRASASVRSPLLMVPVVPVPASYRYHTCSALGWFGGVLSFADEAVGRRMRRAYGLLLTP